MQFNRIRVLMTNEAANRAFIKKNVDILNLGINNMANTDIKNIRR